MYWHGWLFAFAAARKQNWTELVRWLNANKISSTIKRERAAQDEHKESCDKNEMPIWARK